MSESNRTYYFRVWKALLGSILGWSEAQINGWSEQKWNELTENPTPAFYRESPAYWCVHEFIPDGLEQRSKLNKFEMMHLKQSLLLDFGSDDDTTFSTDFDWQAIRDQVKKTLAIYGGELPVNKG